MSYDPQDAQSSMRWDQKRLRQLEIGGPKVDLIGFPFGAGWGQYAGFGTCVVRKTLNEVRCFGLLTRTSGTIASTISMQLIGTMPVGFRPAQTSLTYVTAHGGAYAQARVDVETDGSVYVQWLAAQPYPMTTFFLDLSGVTYPAGG